MKTIDGSSNDLGFDEVVDTIADAISFGKFVEKQLSDGFGFDDAIALIPQYPKLQEMYEDRKLFAAQFLDLTAEESKEAVKQIAARTDVSESVVAQKGVQFVRLASRAFHLYDYTKAEALALYEDAKDLVAFQKAA